MAKIAESDATLKMRQQEAAARAVNQAKISVADADRQGAIGEAQAESDRRIKISVANSEAIAGENEAKAKVAESESTLRQRQAEATRKAIAAERILEAKALQEAYLAQQEAEHARAAKEQATLQADVLVKAEIQKKQLEINAEAQAEQIRIKAKGEADAIFAKMEAEAKGIQEMLSKQAEGFSNIVNAAGGNTTEAMRLMIAEKIDSLVATQVEAIKNIKIDRVTVWDSGNGANGSTSTANFLSGMMKAVPPLNEMFAMAGLELPDYLGKRPVQKAAEQSKKSGVRGSLREQEAEFLEQFALSPEDISKK